MADCPGACNHLYRLALARWQTQNVQYRHEMELHIKRVEAGEPSESPHPPRAIRVDPAQGEPVWCGSCGSEIQSAISVIRAMALVIAGFSDENNGKMPESGKPERTATRTGSPSGSPSFDIYDEIVSFMVNWADEAAGLMSEPTRQRLWWTDRAGALEHATNWLFGWCTAILESSLALRFGVEVLRKAGQVERAAGRDQALTRLQAPCRKCDRVRYVHFDGSERVHCTRCGDVMTMSQYEQWARLVADHARRERRAR